MQHSGPCGFSGDCYRPDCAWPLFSGFFRQDAQKKFQWADTKMSDGVLRGFGVLGVSVGALLVYLGLYVV